MQSPPIGTRHQELFNQANRLEATFLSQMLSHAGVDKAFHGMGGGDAAAQFASFLRDAQADSMVRAGGLGLSESLFRALLARDGAAVAGGDAHGA